MRDEAAAQFGILSSWPIRRVELTVIPFSSAMARGVVSKSAAIPLRVSPDWTR